MIFSKWCYCLLFLSFKDAKLSLNFNNFGVESYLEQPRFIYVVYVYYYAFDEKHKDT